MKTALITGISGQDGAYLSQLLLQKGYQIYGSSRQAEQRHNFTRLAKLGIEDNITLIDRSLPCEEILTLTQPDEVYNLEGQSSVADSFIKPFETIESNGYSTLQWLEAIRKSDQTIRFYQASSTEIFGESSSFSVDENSTCNPKSPYAVSKLLSHHLTRNYREAYNLFACCGILSNHESPLRGDQYVTQKITRSVAAIAKGEIEFFEIGNLSVQRDWGHAKDYVHGMYLMLQQELADDYILASGKLHSVRDLVNEAFKVTERHLIWQANGLDEIGICAETGKTLVRVNPQFYRPTDLSKSLGSPLKAINCLNWEPTITFSELIEEMVKAQL